MTLEELDSVISKIQRPQRFHGAYQAQRDKEDRAIAKLECPECGCNLKIEPSKYGTGVKYYHCSNPNIVGIPHLFLR